MPRAPCYPSSKAAAGGATDGIPKRELCAKLDFLSERHPTATGGNVHAVRRTPLYLPPRHHRETSGAVRAPGQGAAGPQPRQAGALRQVRDRRPEFLSARSEEHTSELQSLMSLSYAVFCLK